MTPRDLKLWRLRLRTLKRDLTNALGEEKAQLPCRAVDSIADRLAREIQAAPQPRRTP
jgi:hypothetical protein